MTATSSNLPKLTLDAQPWIGSARFDIALIILPGLIAMLISFFLPIGNLAPWQWLLLVMVIDVSHVYATVFRTYFDRTELAKRPLLYYFAPLVCFIIGYELYIKDPVWFWRWVAYFNAWHFLRQQYGFTMIYSRFERHLPVWCKRLDQIAIYYAMLFPLISWHFSDMRHYWIIEGDFFPTPASHLVLVFNQIVAAVIALAWLMKEIYLARLGQPFNWPKSLIILVTASIGLMPLQTAVAYTATIAIAHSLPYSALIFLFERKRAEHGVSPYHGLFKSLLPGLIAFLTLMIVFCFVEEVLWDSLYWRDEDAFFTTAAEWLRHMVSAPPAAIIAPLLVLPQIMHYVIDAVIWKRDLPNSDWSKVLFTRPKA